MEELKIKYSEVPGIENEFPIEDFIKFYSIDGLKLQTYKYPAKSPRCLVYTFHGLHGYSNNNATIAKYLSEINCEVLAFDQRGHGKSEGTRGLINSFDALVQDSINFIKETSKNYDLPIFLHGGSMGGCLCLHIHNRLSDSIKGMVLFCPAIASTLKCQGLVRCFAACISDCCPACLLVKPNPKQSIQNEQVINYLIENPYIYSDRVRIGTISSLSTGMNQAKEMVPFVTSPFVVIQGTDDKVVDPKMAQFLSLNAPVQDKSLWMYSGLGHTLSYEKEIYAICERVQQWVNERLLLLKL